MGLQIESRNNYLPLTIYPSSLNGISYKMPVSSAQVKSAVLLAGLGAEDDTTVIEKVKSRDHTEIMLQHLGADLIVQEKTITLKPLKSKLNNFTINVPADPSSAAFFAAAAAAIPDSDLTVSSLLTNPTRTGFYRVLEDMGVKLDWAERNMQCGESTGSLRVRPGKLHSFNINEETVPSVIDELPILAVLAAFADGRSTVVGAAELRVKETDRIAAICKNLSQIGVDVEEYEDGFAVTGRASIKEAELDSFGDHRIAMAFTIAGIIAGEKITITNDNCINISLPEFYTILRSVTK